jgi:hypothetical protein
MEGVVPGAVHGMPLQRQSLEALFADRDPDGVVAVVEVGLDPQTGARGRGRDRLNNDLMAGQRPAPPVERDVREQSVLDFVPLACRRRIVTDGDSQPRFGCQGRQFALPHAVAVAVGAACVGGDQQA